MAFTAAGLVGCTAPTVRVAAESAVQVDGIGDAVRLEASFCVAGAGDGNCATVDPASLPSEVRDAGVQLLAGFLVPDAATAPATATAGLGSAGDGRAVTMARRPSLDETLERTRPAPAGRHWVGYASATLTPAPGAAGAFSVTADFGVARGSGGLPQPATFAHAAMGGARLAYADGDAHGVALGLLGTRPVDCAEQRPVPDGGGGAITLPTTACGATSPGGTLALSDLRGAGAVVSAAPGSSATLPFTLRYVGTPGPAFALRATTAVPHGTATPSSADLSPATGFEDVAVRVAVPSGTAPGEYAVELTADTGGQVRRALGRLVVTEAVGDSAGAAQGEPKGEDPGMVEGAAAPSTVAGASASAPATGWRRFLDFRPFDASGLGADGTTVNAGEVVCRKLAGWCWPVTAQLAVRAEQLHTGARAADAVPRVRMVVIARTSGAVPAFGRRTIAFRLGPRLRALLRAGGTLQAVVAVRAAPNLQPMTRRITLRG
jgi:hypothetical protein